MSEKEPTTRAYYLIFLCLLVLTGLTVGVSYLDLGDWHLVVGMAIATVKATLVVLIFMHLAYDKRLTMVVFSAALLWLAILFLFTFSDYLTRSA